jgi:peptidoglycan DL-endopeptidase CwlO
MNTVAEEEFSLAHRPAVVAKARSGTYLPHTSCRKKLAIDGDGHARLSGTYRPICESGHGLAAGVWRCRPNPGTAAQRRRCGSPRRSLQFGALQCCWRADTGWVSTDALIRDVANVLERGHGLFGPLPSAGGQPGAGGLAGVGERLRGTHAQMDDLAGAGPAHYHRFAKNAVQAMDVAAGTDTALRNRLRAAHHADGSGRVASAAVVHGAASDTTALASTAATPAGQRVLIAALRARLVQQQRVVDACRARDRRLAAAVQSLRYARQAAGGVMPGGAASFGGRGSGGSPFSVLSGLPVVVGASRPGRDQQAALVDWRGDPRGVAVEPGIDAAKAALSKRGCPYVWGAKGPNRFDCSGLTQWAWHQAGVTLGADTYTQIKEGIAVPAGQVRPGDLIFPLDSFGRAGPGHVQLAISDHQVVHAPTPGDVVRITAMPTRYIARRPLRTPIV